MSAAATFCATLVDEWARSGLTDAVICPGSRSTPLAMALAEDGRLRVHVQHDERSGAFMALGLGLCSGRPAIVVTTSGTATANLHPAVVEADLSGVPLILCTSDRPPELRDRGAPQTIDQTHLFGRSVRWFHDPGVPDAAASPGWRALGARVVMEATGGRPGPVQLNLPFREPLLGEPGALPPEREGGGPWARVAPARSSARSFPPWLSGIVRGVVVAGRSDADPGTVRRLGAALGWPVLADPRSGCRVPGEVVAHADSFLRSETVAAVLRPDAVLRVGEPPASRVLSEWLATPGAREVVVADRHLDPLGSAEEMILGSPGEIVAEWVEAASATRANDDWARLWRRVDDASAEAIARTLDGEGLTEPTAARTVLAGVPAGSVVVTASSMPVRDVEWYSEPRTGVTVLANRGANGIDGVVSTAVGVALSGTPTTALVGDLAFLHDTNALLTLDDRAVALTVVVVDNDGGGIFSFLPQADALARERYEQLFGTPHGVDPLALAAAHGVRAVEVASPEALEAEVAAPRGAKVVVLRTDRTENADLHRRIQAAVGRAAGAVLDAPPGR